MDKISNSLFDFVSTHLNLLSYLLLFELCLVIFTGIKKKSKLAIFAVILYTITEFLFDFYLFVDKSFNVFLFVLLILNHTVFFESNIIWFTHKIIKPKKYLTKRFLQKLLLHVISIYALISISFFNKYPLMKYGLLFVYLVNLYFIFKIFSNQIAFFKLYKNKNEAFEILRKNYGTELDGLPLTILIHNPIICVVNFIGWLAKFQKSKFNFGIYDIRNRIALITFNKDKLLQTGLIVWILAIILMNGVKAESVFYSILSVGVLYILRNIGNNSMTKYYTSLVGETVVMRPSIYDDLLTRVLPNKKNDWLSKVYLKGLDYSYSLFFFNQQYIYQPTKGFLKSNDLAQNSQHLILVFQNDESSLNFICENCLIQGLSSPIMIIDSWQAPVANENLMGDISGDHKWLKIRLNLIQKLSDESFSYVDTRNVRNANFNDDQNKQMLVSQFRQSVLKSSSFESLRINIDLFENYYSELDHNRIKMLNGKGVYELNTLFRQLHESPSVPSRFIDLLNIAECISRYLVGMCNSCQINKEEPETHEIFDTTKAIAFGSCVNFLARYKNNTNYSSTILRSKVVNYIDIKYDDQENIALLISFIKSFNPNAKYTNQPCILDILKWLVEVRNKTRGHGTPSKVVFDFYVCMEKLVLFLLAEFSLLEFKFCFIANIEGLDWTFDLSHGGFPGIVPKVDNLEKSVHFNPLMPDDLISTLTDNHKKITDNIHLNDDSPYFSVQHEGKEEWWKCDSHFMVKDGILYILNERKDKKNNWISFSTGKIVRPEIITM